MALNKKILFINPPTPHGRKFTRNADCAAESKGNYLWQPYDFLHLSGAFDPSDEIQFIDAVADKLTESEIYQKIIFIPDLIVTSTIEALWDIDLAFLIRLREKYQQIPILCFGDILIEEANSQEVLKYADGIILNPFTFKSSEMKEWTRLEIKNRSAEIGLRQTDSFKKINKTSVQGNFLQPRHEMFLNPAYRWPFASYKRYTTITTSWGCPFSCSYCTGAQLPSLYRPAEEILQEMKRIKDLGIKEIYFSDKSFGNPFLNTKKILEGMIQENFNFSWSTYFHPQQYNKDFLELMKKSGCHTIIIGIESQNLNQLRAQGRIITQDKISDLLKHAQQLNLNVCGDFIFGLPEDTEESVAALTQYSTTLNLDYASFNIAAPLPGSSIKKMALASGRLKDGEHNFDSVGRNKILRSENISAENLFTLRNLAVKKFYIRPRYLFKRLLRLRGFEHLVIQLQEMFEILKKTENI